MTSSTSVLSSRCTEVSGPGEESAPVVEMSPRSSQVVLLLVVEAVAAVVAQCPASPAGLLPLSQCRGRESDCWSVGQPDVDCRWGHHASIGCVHWEEKQSIIILMFSSLKCSDKSKISGHD